jgi:hypothetical protein
MAAGIPGAKFVVLQSNNHILLEQDPATQRFFRGNQIVSRELGAWRRAHLP